MPDSGQRLARLNERERRGATASHHAIAVITAAKTISRIRDSWFVAIAKSLALQRSVWARSVL